MRLKDKTRFGQIKKLNGSQKTGLKYYMETKPQSMQQAWSFSAEKRFFRERSLFRLKTS